MTALARDSAVPGSETLRGALASRAQGRTRSEQRLFLLLQLHFFITTLHLPQLKKKTLIC